MAVMPRQSKQHQSASHGFVAFPLGNKQLHLPLDYANGRAKGLKLGQMVGNEILRTARSVG